jgi:tellurite resistance protein TerC
VDLPWEIWGVTIAALIVMLAVDLVVIGRKPHAVSMREAGAWVSFYVVLALVFGFSMLWWSEERYAAEFFAGYLTEYSLSVDNLFVFVLIMGRFAVPKDYQQKVLMVGIVMALLFRGIFIAGGAALVNTLHWVFYLFGAFLVYTAIGLVRKRDEPEEFKENVVLRLVSRVVPTSRSYDGARLTTRLDGRRAVTPMFVVMVAIGTTDLLFAVDSIPAIFGLTKEPYLVFTANAFALMGLRQLYFLLGGALEKLVYLSYGLAVILGFIGLKLIAEAAHADGASWAPEVPIPVSLGMIAGTLAITVGASLLADRRARPASELEVSGTGRDQQG